MTPLRRFEEFLDKGIVIKRPPNLPRARSLIEEVEERKKLLYQVLKRIGISDSNANYFVENSYDIIIELLRAKLLLEGFYSSGVGAHEAEVSFMRNMGFPEPDVRFMNGLRYFRNGIKYYGKRFGADYGKKVVAFMEKVYPRLTSALKGVG
jgi:hypothetical protein